MLLILADPVPIIKKLQQQLDEILRAFNHFHGIDYDKRDKAGVVRHLILSAPGEGNQADFKEWIDD